MRKRLVLVVGPESSGTRGTTKLLVDNGYWGSTKHRQPLDDFIFLQKPLNEIVPEEVNKVVLRRSIPHDKDYPSLHYTDTQFLTAGYKTTWLVVLRDLAEITRSKVLRKHARDETQATFDTLYQYNWLFQILLSKTSGVHFFPYTYHMKNPSKALEVLKSFEII